MGLDSYFRIARASEEDIDNAVSRIHRFCPKLTEKLASLEDYEVREIVREYLMAEPHWREIAYFRKWHCLNQFFEYGDDEYDTDMPVSKEQIERLRDIGSGLVKDGRFDAKKYDLETLRDAMQEILDDTDWENERVYYNADW